MPERIKGGGGKRGEQVSILFKQLPARLRVPIWQGCGSGRRALWKRWQGAAIVCTRMIRARGMYGGCTRSLSGRVIALPSASLGESRVLSRSSETGGHIFLEPSAQTEL